jgi:hypothetical protein
MFVMFYLLTERRACADRGKGYSRDSGGRKPVARRDAYALQRRHRPAAALNLDW